MKNIITLGARTSFDPNLVTHLEGDINYTLIHKADGKSRLLSSTLKIVHSHLENLGGFVRISKKFVVNMNYVKTIKDNQVYLESGEKLVSSRRMKKNLVNYLT